MADDKPKFASEILQFRRGRLCFAKTLHEAALPTGKNGKPRANAKPQHNWEIVLDPSNADHAKTIAEIKAESVRALNHRYGDGKFTVKMLEGHASATNSFPNFHLCWGYGNDLPKNGKKLYDGYKDMFYVKMKRFEEDGPPLLANRRGALVTKGQPQCPYPGSYVNGRFTLWSYDNESRGVNSTGRSLQFVEEGKAFGGGGQLDAEQEFEALGDETPTGNGGDAEPTADPFAIK